MPRKKSSSTRGFTLVESLVAVGLFTIVTTISSSAFLAMVNADRVSRSQRIATDNLSLALEDISRRIKTGAVYGCDPVNNGGAVNSTRDCAAGAESFAFTEQDRVTRTIYKRGIGQGDPNSIPAGCGSLSYSIPGQGCILRFSRGVWIPITSHEIDVKKLTFVVDGSNSTDLIQPHVTILIEGFIQASPTVNTQFKMQTMATQRELDI